jgi:hypothetical protein
MNPLSSRCVRPLIDAHFAGALSPPNERALRAHLPGCEACRGYYHRHLILAKLDPRAIGAEERIAAGLGLRVRRKSTPAWSLALAFCAVAALFVVVPFVKKGPADFTARGGALGPAKAEFLAYRIGPSGAGTDKLTQGSTVRSTDDLAFAYCNPSGFHRLLVYGVDEHRHVYWYYPAWSNPVDDPHAIALAAGPGVRELPDAIRHNLDGRELTIHAVFLDDDASVRRVERLVAESQAAGDPLPIAGSYEERLSLVVEH